MQKKLIALAVAAVVTAPAFAQSNVTIYGRVDMGYSFKGDNVNSAIDDRNGFDSSLLAPSFIGFKGVEDLGNGLKVGFDVQTRLDFDVNEERDFLASPSRRDAFLYVAGGFGTVAMGRLTTFQDSLLGSVDPMVNSALGYAGTWTQAASGLGYDNSRLDNVLAYISPNFSGLTVKAAYTFNANGQETGNGDVEVWAVSPVYQNGPLMVGANYHQVDVDGANAEETVWDLAAAYDFGMVKLSAAYGEDETEIGANSETVKQWFVGATVPVGAAGKVALVYGEQENDDVANSQTERWGIGYTHDLSKRTTLYAQYGSYDYDTNSFDGLSGYEDGFIAGIQHRF
ncbi:MAG TPA: porin [Alphaproteobacteria bacterium]|nr:porin [Alphaproteobacteria bacterium]